MYIDMSTVGPRTVRSIAARFPKGVAVVDAPVRGSVSQAAEGRLQIFVGASDEDFERVRPILDALGSVVHVGGLGPETGRQPGARGVDRRCRRGAGAG
jgi:3-hydroxyisobutyrate dehydrogenase-like beta-hydroxyacid dehydrogenase